MKIYAQNRRGEMTQSPGGTLLSGAFDWTENTAQLDIPKDAEQVWVWFLFNAPAEGTLWVDDARFEVVPLPAPDVGVASPAKKK